MIKPLEIFGIFENSRVRLFLVKFWLLEKAKDIGTNFLFHNSHFSRRELFLTIYLFGNLKIEKF